MPTTIPDPATCELCAELRGSTLTRFHQIYGAKLSDRVVAAGDGLVAIASLGQLFPGSLMVLPTEHLETMAMLSLTCLKALPPLVDRLSQRLCNFGFPAVFEHGARSHTGGGCGIYHAHLHLVPLPSHVDIADLFPERFEVAHSLISALSSLTLSDQYLLFRDTKGRVGFQRLSGSTGRHYPSQYFRRRLSQLFNIKRPWDWRDYQFEPRLVSTVTSLRSAV